MYLLLMHKIIAEDVTQYNTLVEDNVRIQVTKPGRHDLTRSTIGMYIVIYIINYS